MNKAIAWVLTIGGAVGVLYGAYISATLSIGKELEPLSLFVTVPLTLFCLNTFGLGTAILREKETRIYKILFWWIVASPFIIVALLFIPVLLGPVSR